ncbi:hypothetical protein [Shimazuella kribbensis]|uniref:hypothetical protein n=1 Tax=Shimazuella kribbensis TaxID=139808 RepID=UPI00040A9F99|nr:hypothetical protein [Shimazuella kribbensis]
MIREVFRGIKHIPQKVKQSWYWTPTPRALLALTFLLSPTAHIIHQVLPAIMMEQGHGGHVVALPIFQLGLQLAATTSATRIIHQYGPKRMIVWGVIVWIFTYPLTGILVSKDWIWGFYPKAFTTFPTTWAVVAIGAWWLELRKQRGNERDDGLQVDNWSKLFRGVVMGSLTALGFFLVRNHQIWLWVTIPAVITGLLFVPIIQMKETTLETKKKEKKQEKNTTWRNDKAVCLELLGMGAPISGSILVSVLILSAMQGWASLILLSVVPMCTPLISIHLLQKTELGTKNPTPSWWTTVHRWLLWSHGIAIVGYGLIALGLSTSQGILLMVAVPFVMLGRTAPTWIARKARQLTSNTSLYVAASKSQDTCVQLISAFLGFGIGQWLGLTPALLLGAILCGVSLFCTYRYPSR